MYAKATKHHRIFTVIKLDYTYNIVGIDSVLSDELYSGATLKTLKTSALKAVAFLTSMRAASAAI
jgi:hypothetical protein